MICLQIKKKNLLKTDQKKEVNLRARKEAKVYSPTKKHKRGRSDLYGVKRTKDEDPHKNRQ
jgi:hypothetical protein